MVPFWRKVSRVTFVRGWKLDWLRVGGGRIFREVVRVRRVIKMRY